jgi:hypothetical protein
MRVAPWSILPAALLLASCLAPLRCSGEGDPHDLGVVQIYDFAVGELGRPPGTPCSSLDQCNRVASDRCSGTCQCGNENPCNAGTSCCDGHCVDTGTDPQNCGGCGLACTTGMCVRTDAGTPHCTCDVDGGAGSGAGCSSPLQPTCNSEGLCTCGPSSAGVCGPQVADSCGAGGCSCGGGPACGGDLVDHCQAGVGCRCGSQPACDPKLATRCNPTATDSPCRCANGPGCAPGTFCCTQNSTCCGPSQFCCLNGCCAHPCLLLGFCDR